METNGPAGSLTVDGRTVPLSSSRMTIGRAPENDLVLDDSRVSRHHAALDPDGAGGLTVTDLGSGNGTFVGSRLLRGQSAPVRNGDELRLGSTVIAVSLPVPALAPAGDQATVLRASPLGPRAESPPADPPRYDVQPPLPPVEPQGSPQPSRLMQISRGTQSAVFRQLQRSSRRSLAVAVGAVVIAVGVAAAAVAGVFSNSTPTATQIARDVAPSTVYVFGTGPGFIENGSGWVYDAQKGLIVTNDHVAEGAQSLTVAVGTAPGAPVSQHRRAATIVGAAPCSDVALLKVADTAGLKTLPLGSQAKLNAGDSVVALGFPVTAARATDFEDAVLIVTSGSVSSPRTTYETNGAGGTINFPNVIQTDTVINHGNSGGPLVNTSEQLVGMNTATFAGTGSGEDVSGENYAIGVDLIKSLLPQLEQGSIGSAGFILDPGVLTSASASGVSGLPQGIAVDAAVNGSPAASLPVKYFGGNSPPYNGNNPPPTILTSINGTQLTDSKVSYCNAVGKLSPDQNTAIGMAVPSLNAAGALQYTAGSYHVVFR